MSPLALQLWLILWCVVAPSPAVAYIEPLTGSVLLQVLAAGALGALFVLKRFWRRVASFARRALGLPPGE